MVPLAIETAVLDKLKRIVQSKLEVEADLFMGPGAVGKRGDRPAALFTLLLADHETTHSHSRAMAIASSTSKPAMKKSEDIKVFISHRYSKCDECGEELGRKAWITLEEGKGALCLACADLDQLVFLPPGYAALTRRARKHSVLSAVVLKFSKARGRYERQGLLVEEDALDKAEAECLADAEARERRAHRERERRAALDRNYVEEFAKRVRKLFPGCPAEREVQIAERACRKYSGRIGRSAGAKSFEEAAVLLAVAAHVRHQETNYDELLAKECDRREARAQVRYLVDEILRSWQRG